MPEGSIPLTIQQLIETIEMFRPERALQLRNASYEHLYATDVITCIRIGERVYDLTEREGRVGAGYVRVSTEGQRQDGFSTEDQAYRIAVYFAERGEAFRVLSDAGLSGTIPINDPLLIQRVWSKKARLYRELFERVFLTNTENKYTASERALMRLFVDDAFERLQTGEEIDSVITKADEVNAYGNRGDGEEEALDEVIEPSKPLNHINIKQKHLFRPALTAISEALHRYHTLAVTDLSRLSRSQLTFAELHEKFTEARVSVVGLVEDLSWMNDREKRNEVGSQIQAFLLPMFAEHKVRETTLGVFRGIATKFDNKKPHAKIPTWLRRTEEGTAEWGDPKRVEAVREMIRLYWEEGLGFDTIAGDLTRRGFKTERGNNYSKATIADVLDNYALCGQQVMFGRKWNVFPAFMIEEDFEEMRQYRAQRAEGPANRGRRVNDYYLLTSRLKCSCGHAMCRRPGRRLNAVPFWACRSTHTQRLQMDRDHPHPNIPDDELEAFFTELLTQYRHVVVDTSRLGREETKASHELAELTEGLRAAEAEYASKKRAATFAAEAQATADGINEENPFFVQYVQIRVAALTNHLREETGRLKERIAYLADCLDQIRMQQQAGGLEKRLADWHTATMREKNQMIQEVFRSIQVSGVPPNEYLELELMNAPAGALPPVPLITKSWARGNKPKYWRKLPSVQEWLEGVFAGEGFDVKDPSLSLPATDHFISATLSNPALM